MKRKITSIIIAVFTMILTFDFVSCKEHRLETERVANEEAGLGRLTNEEVENERILNEISGYGRITNAEAENEREQNEAAGFGRITNAEKNAVVLLGQGFVFVEGTAGGMFKIGSIAEIDYEKHAHFVTLDNFYICDHEVTQKEYRDIMGAEPSRNKGDNKPVDSVSWYDAIEYCNARSLKEGFAPCYKIDKERKDSNNLSGNDREKWTVDCDFSANGYRLPTEAEWEYAARGGNMSEEYIYSGSNDIDNVAWYSKLSGKNFVSKTQDVRKKSPNELGLYDMSGNVSEWCWDWYASYSSQLQMFPTGGTSGDSRVNRGGDLNPIERLAMVTKRNHNAPSSRLGALGFRVVCSANCDMTKFFSREEETDYLSSTQAKNEELKVKNNEFTDYHQSESNRLSIGSILRSDDNLRLRARENTDSTIITTMSKHTKVQILDIGKEDESEGVESNWVLVEVLPGGKDRDGKRIPDGTTGWCFGGFLEPFSE